MIKGKAIIFSENGIHARPAALIAAAVRKSESDVVVRFRGTEVDPGNFMKLMSMGIKKDDEVELIVEGSDEEDVFHNLKNIMETSV